MRAATITTTSGYSWTTDVNGTDESICDYFLGRMTDVAAYPDERLELITSVVIDGKAYGNGVRRGEWVTGYFSYSLTGFDDANRERWCFDARTVNARGMDTQETLRVFGSREECIAEYLRRCPCRVVPFNLQTEFEGGTLYAYADTQSL